MKKIFIVILSAVSLRASAQVVPADLKEMVLHSFGHYAKLRSMEAQQRIAAGQVALSKADRLPEVNGTASYMHVYPVAKIQLPGSDFTFQPLPSENVNAGIEARQLLLDFGKTGSSIHQREAEAKLLGAQVSELKERLAYQVANTYLHIAYLNDNIAVQDANIRLLEETEQMVENKLKHGDAIDLDLLNTRVKLESYRNRKVDYQNALRKEQAALEYYTGDTVTARVHSDYEWPVADEVLNGLEHNAALETAVEQEHVAETGVESAKAMYKPSLFLDAGTGYKNGYLPDVSTPKFNYNAGVSLSVPIFHGRKLRTRERMAERQVEVAKWNTADVKNSLRMEVIQQQSDITSNRERLLTAEVLLQQAERALQLARSRYKNGVITYLDLQNAQTSMLEAQLSKIQYQYQLSVSSLALLRLNGNEFWR